jgi:hypothetical protein
MSSSAWKKRSTPSPPRCRPAPPESGASSTFSSSHGFFDSHTSVGEKRVAASAWCRRLFAPSPWTFPPWPTGCGDPSAHGSPSSRTPHQTSAARSPPLHAGTAAGTAFETAS